MFTVGGEPMYFLWPITLCLLSWSCFSSQYHWLGRMKRFSGVRLWVNISNTRRINAYIQNQFPLYIEVQMMFPNLNIWTKIFGTCVFHFIYKPSSLFLMILDSTYRGPKSPFTSLFRSHSFVTDLKKSNSMRFCAI